MLLLFGQPGKLFAQSEPADSGGFELQFFINQSLLCLSAPSATSMLKLTWSFFAAKICGEDGQVDPNCFVTAQSIVFNAMEQE